MRRMQPLHAVALAVCALGLSISTALMAQAPAATAPATEQAPDPAASDPAATGPAATTELAAPAAIAENSAASVATAPAPADTSAAAATQSGSRDAWKDPATAPAEILNLDKVLRSMLLDGANSRDRAVIVGDRGHILVSESRREWRQVPAPTRTMLTAVSAVDNKLWAVGHDQVIIGSADGGLTWSLQHSDIAAEGPLLDVLFLDPDRGFAVGAYGQFLSTTDAGATWSVQAISDRTGGVSPAVATPDASEAITDPSLASTDVGEDEGDPHLNGIARSDAGLLIVGEAGAAYRSIDQGATWERADLPYEGSMFGAVALDNGTIIAYGLRGNAYATADLGRSWQKLETGTDATLLGGAAVSGGRAVLVGASGTVLLAPPGSTALRGLSFPEGGVMSGVLPLAETEFLVMGENGVATYQPN